ncbi:hypothetical protein GGI26_000260 [Coemansia sp. RSA 1358]|uniref:Uncharacterized protein n=1 Tax=Coemansia umbellata TaxID=1424467 RepID=A0ABQ8PV62_9FUNG|nr:hypothetical protein EDC05_000559 [Coemansia umbellata]KAJ2625799.1 hypothetical protein GGI26_000260 [Coemansia sp. RSA 1358]
MALYSKQDLKESQILYQDCEFISKKTRSIYAWRTALWVRYCKEHATDYTVTEDKLINYLDWLFEIDLVNKINTKKSYVPDILRDHMGSVICLWRIQTGNDPDLVSPKEGTRYQAKWDEILRNYPRREKFQARAYIPETQGFDPIGTGSGSSGMALSPPGMRSSLPCPASSAAIYNDSKSSRHYSYHQPYRQHHDYNSHYYHHQHAPLSPQQAQPPAHYHDRYQQQKQQQQYRSHHMQAPPLPRSLQSPQYPVGLPESTELRWQLRWLKDGEWASSTARFLFTIAMCTWVEAVNVVGLRMIDARFASSTMAPRLPSSVLRISLKTQPAADARSEANGDTHSRAIARQQFSIIRSRNPLLCAWNALAVMLFHRWHIANLPALTFANASWQSMLMLSPCPKKHDMPASPEWSDRRGSGSGISLEAVESGLVTAEERVGLVRDLLPVDRLPIERIVRLRPMERAQQQLSVYGSSGSPSQRDLRMARGNSTGGIYTGNIFTPLTDTESVDRLSLLAPENSGYYENHHCIQRHKVIPSDSLQHTDIAVLKCCTSQLPEDFYGTSGILNHPIFNTAEFAAFCDQIQTDAADEIHTLQYDLSMAMGDPEPYRTDTGGTTVVASGLFDKASEPKRLSGDDISTRGVMLPPITSSQNEDAIMLDASPEGEEVFSPTISPSPPVSSTGARGAAAAVAAISFSDSPRSTDGQMQTTPQQTPQSMSQSLPARPFDGWNESYFKNSSSGGSTPGGSGIPPHAAKRRRPEHGEGAAPAPQPGIATSSSSPYPPTRSPRGTGSRLHHGHHTQHQRIPRSPPGTSYSPRIPASSLGPSSNNSRTMNATTLPSIAQFTQSPLASSPMQIGSPNMGRGVGQQQHYMHPSQQQQQLYSANAQRRDLDPYSASGSVMRRPSDSATGDSSSSGRTGMVAGRDEYGYNEVEQINMLREENAYLKQRLQNLEITVAQKQLEVQNWMSRMEKYLMRDNTGR